MAKYVWLIHTNAREGRDHEFNEWYSNTHIPDLLRVPGVVSAKRYDLAGYQTVPKDEAIVVTDHSPALKYRYLAVYHIETEDLRGVLETVAQRAGTEEMRMSDALDPDILTQCYEQI